MQDSLTLDDLDRALVHALQIAPRASWARLGAALGVDPVTASRRWNRLFENGVAWITCHPGEIAGMRHTCMAFIEVDCTGGTAHEVGAALSRDPQVLTVEHVTGPRDLLVTVLVDDHVKLSRWVLGIGGLNGVVATRTQLVTSLHTEGSRWRLNELSRGQRELLTGQSTSAGTGPRPVRIDRTDRELMLTLTHDGRASYRRLGERVGVSADTARRRVERLKCTGALILRCELARSLSDWPVSVTFWTSVPTKDLHRVAPVAAGLRESRLCVGTTGTYNLMLAAWLRSMRDVRRFEDRLAERLPGVVIGDRAVTLLPMKLAGHILDEGGFRKDTVPVDVWRECGGQPAEHEELPV